MKQAKHLCIVDNLEEDNCVLDENRHNDCLTGTKLFNEGKTKFECRYYVAQIPIKEEFNSRPPALTYKQIENVFNNIFLFIRKEGYFPSSNPCHRIIETGKLNKYLRQALKTMKDFEEFNRFSVEDDMSFRSLCSQKFAKAFFEANH